MPSASAYLEGYGVFNSPFFHTYVLSSAQDIWGCHGGSTSGRRLCKGHGPIVLARCLEGGDEAGIYYLRTGVCHQIANRILAAAGIEIPISADAQVRGSQFTYGKFGRNHSWVPADKRWPDRWNSCNSPVPGASAGSASSDSTHLSNGISSMTRTAPLNPDPRSELFSLIEVGLGHPVEKRKFAALAAMREHLQDKMDQLSDLLMNRKIDPSTYLEDLDKALIEASHTGEEILGYTDFHKIFGELRVNKLGDARAFIAEYLKGH